MAITMVLQVATGYRLKYLVSYDGAGGGGSASIITTKADLISDLDSAGVRSPLKELLEATTADLDWGNLDKGSELSVYVQPITGPSPVTADVAVVVSDGQAIQVNGIDGDAYSAIIEIKYNHSIDR